MNETASTSARRVVVGVDGSVSGQRALALAIEEARNRGARLEIVHVWHTAYAVGPTGSIALPMDDHEQRADAGAVLDLCVTDALRHETGPPVPLDKNLVKDHNAARALIEAAKGADLLVVGSHGRGGFAGLLLGSVSNQCVHHAPCPVLVVRDGD